LGLVGVGGAAALVLGVLEGPEERAHDGRLEDEPRDDEERPPPAVLRDEVADERREDEGAQARAAHRDARRHRPVLVEVTCHGHHGGQVD